MSDASTHTLPHQHIGAMQLRTLRVDVLDEPTPSVSRIAEGNDRISIGTAEGNDLVLSDSTVSRFHLGLTLREDGVLVEDAGSTNGTFLHGIRVERAVVPPGTVLTIGKTQLKIAEGAGTEVELHEGDALGDLRGSTPAMRRLLAQIRRAAQSDVPVLLVGESGTGKELIARALHELGGRSKKPFETVDCASLSPTLVASELFGHERGAFTGADRRHAGAFERAHGGTLFLDEIGELPEALQPALLGALERRRFRRLGAREEINVDLRVICATHRDLRTEVNAGRFRLDLYYRIAVIRLDVPPLRDRLDDLPLLVSHFVREAGHTTGPEAALPPNFLTSLRRHVWPGNVRELRNVVEATLAMGEPPLLDAEIGRSLSQTPGPMPSVLPPAEHTIALDALLDRPYKDARQSVLEHFEAAYLKQLLERAKNNVSQAARDAHMDRSHLWELLRRHGLK